MFHARTSARPRQGLVDRATATAAVTVLGLAGVIGAAVPVSARAASSVADAATSTVGRAPADEEPLVLVGSQQELRRAVAAANRRPGVDRIGLTRSVGLAKGSGAGQGALRLDLDVTDDLVLNGSGFGINGRGLDRVLDVAEGARLELNNITLRGGAPAAASQGGGLLRVSDGQARLGRVTLREGEATGDAAAGGAVLNDGGRLVLVNSTVTGSTASGGGGGVAARGGATVVRRSTLQDNAVTQGSGGGLRVTDGGTVTLTEAQVTGNQAALMGGGLSISGGARATVRSSRVEDNIVSASAEGARGGGGVYVGGSAGAGGDEPGLTMSGSAVVDNFVSTRGPSFETSGGGLLLDGAVVEVRDSAITGNTALADGGGVSAIGGSTTLEGTDLTGNTARKSDRGAPLG